MLKQLVKRVILKELLALVSFNGHFLQGLAESQLPDGINLSKYLNHSHNFPLM